MNLPNKLVALAASAICAVTLAGCFSVDTARSATAGRTHVLVSNSGWRLFNVIPLCCGNAAPEAERLGPWAFFRDDVTLDKVQGRFMEVAQERGLEPQDLVYRNIDNVLFNIPFVSIPVPLPYLLCYREIQLSGVLK